MAPAYYALAQLMFLASNRHVLFFRKVSLSELFQNLFAEFRFIKIIAVVMVVGVVTDFEMTFIADLFKIAWQNNDFVFKESVP